MKGQSTENVPGLS